MDYEFDEAMNNFRIEKPINEVQISLRNYIEQQWNNYIIYIEKKEFKLCYIIMKKLYQILIQNLKLLCTQLQCQMNYFAKILILILDEDKQFTQKEVQNILERYPQNLTKLDMNFNTEGKILFSYFESDFFKLICCINNIGCLNIIRRRIEEGQNSILRAIELRHFIIQNELHIYQSILLSFNIAIIMRNNKQISSAEKLMFNSMNALEELSCGKSMFFFRNNQQLNLMQYFFEKDEQNLILNKPTQNPQNQIQFNLILGYYYFYLIFEELKNQQQSIECLNFYKQLLENYQNNQTIKTIQQDKINKEVKVQVTPLPKETKQETKKVGENILVYFKENRQDQYNVAVYLYEKQEYIQFLIYSTKYGFKKKYYMSIWNLNDKNYNDEITYSNLLQDLQVIDIQKGLFKLKSIVWYDTLGF